MSTRRVTTPLGEVAFDHGAQYFTARDPGFRKLVARWEDEGLAAPWPAARPDAWVGVPAMSSVVRKMASGHIVLFGSLVKGLVRNKGSWHLITETEPAGPFDAVVIAIPAEQAAPILALQDFEMARIALLARSQPCWTSMLAFDAPLPTKTETIRDDRIVGWAARNSAKPGRSGPEAWVVQASAHWTALHIDKRPEIVAHNLLTALSGLLAIPTPVPIAAVSHRWRYALSAGTGDGALWNSDLRLGACGDWLLGPRVECAWLSGRAMADRMTGPGTLAVAETPSTAP